MQTILATFENGVLRPVHPLNLPARSQVRLTIELLGGPALTVGGLNAFLQSLPSLGDDREAFSRDVRKIRAEIPAEANPWE
jgi:hypothetical protein